LEGDAAPVSISLIVSVHDSAPTLPLLWSRIEKSMAAVGQSYEAVFVDDASVDNSAAVLKDIARRDRRVRIVVHDRNAGQAAAILTGIAHARGSRLVTLDDDLQHRPEDIPRLLRALVAADENTLVVGVADAGRGPWWRSLARTLANGISRLFLKKPVPMRLSALCAFHKSLGETLIRAGSHRIAWVATLAQSAERTLPVVVRIDDSALPHSRYDFWTLWALFRRRSRLFVLGRILTFLVVSALVGAAAIRAGMQVDDAVALATLLVLAAAAATVACMMAALALMTLAERYCGPRSGEGAPRARLLEGP
jgi:glycosyltransferase involved in cell wall biosynthesis